MLKHEYTKETLNKILANVRGKSLGTVDKNGVFQETKVKRINGIAGNVIEQSVLGYPSNSDQNPDLLVDGIKVELKTTGIKRTKRPPYYGAKERLTITAVSPKNIVDESFETSHFWSKASHLLFVYYLYDSVKPVPAIQYKNFIIQDYQFFSFSKNDQLEIQREWEKIKEIYTRYQDDYKSEEARNALRGLGYLEVVAKETNPRIALSQKYFNVIVRQFFGESFEPILKEDEQTQTVEQSVMGLFRPYVGLYRSELCRQFKVSIPEKNPKAVNSTLARKMLRLNTDIQNSAEFQKANIAVKVLTVKSDNVGSVNTHHQRTKESLKIQNYFDFGKILNETWEESDLRTYLFDTKFLLVLFEDTGDDQIFKGAKFWQVPLEDLDGPIKYVWERTRHILREGVTLSYIPYNNSNGYRILNNLPAASDHNVLHVRPDAKKSSYKVGDANSLPLPAPVKWKNRPKHLINELSNNWMTKQAFWLNSDYMYQQVADLM